MKKLIALFVVAIMATTVTFAAHNESVTASATFTTKVIAPLAWDNSGDVDLPVVINGQTRTFTGVGITFTLTGEAEYAVTFTKSGPDEVEGVLLQGSWSADIAALDASGNAQITYTCTGVDASGASSIGTKVFTVGVTAEYSGI